MESQADNIFIYLTLFKELDKQYANSKFILNLRNREQWISRLNHRDYLKVYQRITGLDRQGVIDLWTSDWNNHLNSLKDYFKERPVDFFVFDIDSETDKLFEFMSKITNLRNRVFGQYNKTKNKKC